MLSSVMRILKLSSHHKTKLKTAFFLSIFESFSVNMPILAFLYGLYKIMINQFVREDIIKVSLILFLGLFFRALFRHGIHVFQSGTGYNMMADERMKLGNLIRRLPMGYFTDGNIGNISSVITSDMVFLEEVAMEKFTVIISSYLNVIIGIIMLSIFNLKMGLLIFIITLISIIMLNIIFKRSKEIAPRRQIVVENLIKSVLEYVRGLSVSKAFNLSGDKSKAASNSFRNIRDIMIEFEKCLTPLLLWHEILIGVGIACVIFMASVLANNGQLEIYFAVIMIVFSFEIFIPLLTLSRTIPMIRIVDAGLDRYQKIKDAKLLDNDGKNIKLDKFDIGFNKVTFAYEDKDIIKDMSFKIEEGTMTALVGKSGCGKTTIANLIARFWDIQNGDIKIGGVSTKSMTCESLLDNISMVFQKVYLFNDTIINNIKFAKPEASYDEIVEVCKKARCHDFILKLDDGYNTMVGEGGCTLSGGEKQRISIARAMLKDAPIILLDEATASVDADNEAYIKEAISDLVRNKTLVVIAHKLSTIKNANQILVIDSGEITQRGTHKELIDLEGYYQDFWKRRNVAKSWTL